MKQFPKIGTPLRRSFEVILECYGPVYMLEIWERYKHGQIKAPYVHGEALHCRFLLIARQKAKSVDS